MPFALLPLAPAAAAWLVAQVVLAAAALAALARRLRHAAPLAVAGLALAFQPTWAVIGGGNISGFLLAATAGALAAALAARPRLCGALLGLLVIKPQLSLVTAPVLLLALPAAQRRSAIISSAIVAVALIGTSVVVRPAWPTEWLAGGSLVAVGGGTNASVWTLDRVGLPAPLPLAIAGLVAIAAAAWWRARRPGLALAVGAAVPLSLFLAPHARIYDQVLLLITLAVIVDRLGAVGSGARLAGTAALALLAAPLSWALYTVALERGPVRTAGPDLGEEWSALLPLAFLVMTIVVDLIARRTRTCTPSRTLERHIDRRL